MIRIAGMDFVRLQTLEKRVGDDVTVKVKLHNSGGSSGSVTLKVDVYEPINELWYRITDSDLGDTVTVPAYSTVTKSYNFKPIYDYWSTEKEEFVLKIRASISGDSSDSLTKEFPFQFSWPSKTTWYDGSDELKVVESFPSTCSGSITEKHSFNQGETVRLLFRAFDFENSGSLRVLISVLRVLSETQLYLYWQDYSTIDTPDPGYYWSCYPLEWKLNNYPKGKYVVYVTAELYPGYEQGIDILDDYFVIV